MTRNLVAKALLAWFITMLCCSPLANATDDEILESSTGLSLHGFGTFGVVRTTSADAEFVRDLSQPKGVSNHWSGRVDSKLGVQANWKVASSVELVGQAVSRYHSEGNFKPEPTLAFAKWDPTASLSLRAGRVGADFLMLADSRLVGYSYLPVRPSVDFYGPLFFTHLDGGDASLTMPVAGGISRGKLFVGQLSEKAPYALGLWDTSGSTVGGAILDYQKGPWRLRGSVASIRFSHNHEFSGLADNLWTVGSTYGYPSAIAAADVISAKSTTSTFYSMGAVYDDGPLMLHGTINHIRHRTGLFQNSHAGYVLAGYRIGKTTPYAGISWVKSSYKNNSTGLPSGVGFDLLNGGFDSLMRATSMNQKTWTLGTRWDFRPDMALKLQWDAIRGKPESRFLFSKPSASWNGKTNVFSLNLDFIF